MTQVRQKSQPFQLTTILHPHIKLILIKRHLISIKSELKLNDRLIISSLRVILKDQKCPNINLPKDHLKSNDLTICVQKEIFSLRTKRSFNRPKKRLLLDLTTIWLYRPEIFMVTITSHHREGTTELIAVIIFRQNNKHVRIYW